MIEDKPLTISVPEAGKRCFNLSRNASYAAAERGEIPVIRVGRLLRVPVRAMERKLDNASERGGARAQGELAQRQRRWPSALRR
jgi:hypothetical protein